MAMEKVPVRCFKCSLRETDGSPELNDGEPFTGDNHLDALATATATAEECFQRNILAKGGADPGDLCHGGRVGHGMPLAWLDLRTHIRDLIK